LATRHQVRESIVGLLYAGDIGNDHIDNFADEIFEEKKIRNKQKDFALDLYNGIKENIKDIDISIDEHLKEWNLDKIGNVERAILRLGAYELNYTELDSAVIINEAIELAKKLCNETSPRFINGVLDAVTKKKIK